MAKQIWSKNRIFHHKNGKNEIVYGHFSERCYNDVTAIACVEDVKILRNGTVVASAPVQNRPMAIAMHENDVVVAGQGFCDLYKLNGGSLTLSGPIEEVVKNKGATSMAFNHAGSVLAVGELKQSGDKSLRLLQVAKGYSVSTLEIPIRLRKTDQ